MPAAAPGSTVPAAAGADTAVTGSSTARSLALLAVLAREGRAMSLAELASRLGLAKATTHRLCSTLLATGHLARDVGERPYALGPVMRALALDTLNQGMQRGLRHQVLAAVVAEVGETCNFTTLDGAEVVYVDRVEARWPLRLTLDVGAHVPLHCTASGKLLLAHMPTDARDTLIDGLTLTRMTPHTITSARALKAECDRIAREGHSCDREEFIAGLVAAAAIALYLFSIGIKAARQVLWVDPRNLFGIGLTLAALSGLPAIFYGQAFFTSQWWPIYLPPFGTLKLSTPLFFDIGVYLVVVGSVLTIVLTLAEAED